MTCGDHGRVSFVCLNMLRELRMADVCEDIRPAVLMSDADIVPAMLVLKVVPAVLITVALYACCQSNVIWQPTIVGGALCLLYKQIGAV